MAGRGVIPNGSFFGQATSAIDSFAGFHPHATNNLLGNLCVQCLGSFHASCEYLIVTPFVTAITGLYINDGAGFTNAWSFVPITV